MLRVTKTLQASGIVVKLEGRLAGSWVREAERVWRSVVSPRIPVAVDLTDMTYADADGRRLLETMHCRGSRLTATTCLTKALVAEIGEVPCDCVMAGEPCGTEERKDWHAAHAGDQRR